MSWQKCMSFSKYSNLEGKKLYISDFVIRKIKGRNIISNKQNFDNKTFYAVFTCLKIKIKDKFKLRTKLNKTKI